MEKTKQEKIILLNKSLYLWLCVIFISLSIIFFVWGRRIVLSLWSSTIDHELWGTFGDFVGGVLGTIFSVISLLLVVQTFTEQQSVTKQNNEQVEVERFNALFFELLHLYQSQVADMHIERSLADGLSLQYTNKDFFDANKRYIQKKYRNLKSYEANQQKSLNYYMLFFTDNHTKLGAYYRTLYRIYDLIDNSCLKEPQKRDYLKIMRAQLTNSELFFLRYNALCYYGGPFRKYITKYHILKHLPVFELLEFKDWWRNLSLAEREGINILSKFIERKMRDTLDKEYNDIVFPCDDVADSKYTISLLNNRGMDVRITVIIDPSKTNHSAELRAFDIFSYKQIEQFLDCYIKEVFIYSNFELFNTFESSVPYSYPMETSKTGVVTIQCGIKSSNNNPLILRYRDVCE